MTEQQIDAELCRYEPYFMWRAGWTWFLWTPDFGVRRPEDVPYRIHRKLKYRLDRYAPTREAALADLRQALAASDSAS